MTTEPDANGDDEVEIVIREVDETFHVRDESGANWVLRKIVEERAYRERVARWCEAETLRSERREQFLMHRFGGELEEWLAGKMRI